MQGCDGSVLLDGSASEPSEKDAPPNLSLRKEAFKIIEKLRSPNKFDNKYYLDLMNHQGLFTSDQDLYTDKRTKDIVTNFAVNQSLFFEKFVAAMLKMGQLNVLTGTKGEIRANCSVRNKGSKSFLTSAVEGFLEM